MIKQSNIILISLCSILFAFSAFANVTLKGAQKCTSHMPQAERYHNIPTHWLAAIANTESGRYNKRLGMTLPWPWTLNVGGKGYYFDTKAAAMKKIKSLHAQGITNMDVGCMQINMHYHGHAFRNVEQAIDPRYNVAYAARFLRNNFDELHSWKKATAAYHSRTPSRGTKYFATVFRKWNKVISKIGGVSNTEMARIEKPSGKINTARKVLPKYSKFTVNSGKPKHKSLKMKTIKVANYVDPSQRNTTPEKSEYVKSRENGVLVMRVPRKQVVVQPIAASVDATDSSKNVINRSHFVF